MLEQNSLKVEHFYNLNPEVKEDCSNMWPSECFFFFGRMIPGLHLLIPGGQNIGIVLRLLGSE